MKNRRAARVVNIISIIVFVVSAINIVKIYYDYKKAAETYDALQNEYVQTVTESVTLSNEVEEEETKERELPPVEIDFNSLFDVNDDVVGWLYSPESPINYPVAQANDNVKYLRHDLKGNYIIAGTIFVDYRNSTPGNNSNYIIYGHNMRNDSMFTTLARYKKQSYYDKHPIIYYLTPDVNYKIELFAGLVIRSDDDLYDPNLPKDELMRIVRDYKNKSTFESDIVPQDDDIIVTLSTCSHDFDNARCVLIGRMIEM